MNHKIFLMEINQPVGTFYISKISSDVLVDIANVNRRDGKVGIQRELSRKRTVEIAKYCEDPDATFPTPIILSIRESDVISIKPFKDLDGIFELEFSDRNSFAEILDGQHRVAGIQKAEDFYCELMIAIVFDVTEEEKAYIFSTINSNQTKVDKSLIYDLFELSKDRSPFKTCHEIARIMNSDKESPFYNRLKMLGKKGKKSETLSQGTFVAYLSKLISKTPKQDMIDIKNNNELVPNKKLVLRKYFINDQDDIILKVLMNYFKAVKANFEYEWDNSDEFILSKTTGYGALIKSFPDLFQKGATQRDLSFDFFNNEFKRIKECLKEKGYELTSDNISSGEQGQRELYLEIIQCIQ